jgi:hypothetical protein
MTVRSPWSSGGEKRSGPRTGVSVISDSRARGKGRIRSDRYAPWSPPPPYGAADPVPYGPMIGENEPDFRRR